MTELRTEEEQLEAIKSWWKDNGKSLVIMILLAVSTVYGYKAWQNQQYNDSESASIMYQQLVDTVVPDASADPVESLATSKHLTKTLKAEHGDSQYAQFGALLMAKVAVNVGELDVASQELDWLIASDATALLKSIASIRKAKILNEQDKKSEALALLAIVSIDSLKVQALELEGDIYLSQGDREKARIAYEKALSDENVGVARTVLSMKLNDLTIEES